MEWISVEDELPNKDCTVDVWMPEYKYDYKRVTDVRYVADSEIFHIDYDLIDVTQDVSHWVKRPKPPTK